MLNLISVKESFHDIFKRTLNITPVNITSYTVLPLEYLEYVAVITPHSQRERGKVIGVGVHVYYMFLYVCLWPKNFESYFSDPLTFSNLRGRTSHRIWHSSTTVFSRNVVLLSKLRIFLSNVHLALFD